MDLDGLDWIVCHSGADIWHAQSDGEWNADDQWENLIDFRYNTWLLACCLLQGIPQHRALRQHMQPAEEHLHLLLYLLLYRFRCARQNRSKLSVMEP